MTPMLPIERRDLDSLNFAGSSLRISNTDESLSLYSRVKTIELLFKLGRVTCISGTIPKLEHIRSL